MTKTLTEILAGEDMEGGEVFCDSVYNFLKNKDRAQNIFTNSGFGVWSQSDANKGIGVIKFDTGDTAPPAVGATVTGANGAKAKVIRMFVVSATWGGTATGYVVLGACGLDDDTTRFEDNEVLTYAGGTIAVNYPDATVQLSVTAATIAFNDADPDTITDTLAGLGGFAAGDVIEVSGSGSNNGFYWVAVAAAGTLTLHANESLTAEPLGTTVTITRRGAGDWMRNGGFAANTGGWTAINCALASVGLGQVTNCLQMTLGGGALQKAYQIVSVEAGKIYKLSAYVKTGTSGNEAFILAIENNGGVATLASVEGTSAAGWVRYTVTWEASEASPRVVLIKNTATPGTMFFDEVSFYEITPCCTEGDVLAFDGWYKDSTLDIYRQYYYGDTLTKHGSFYSLKCVPSAVADNVVFPRAAFWTLTEWYQKFIEETVTMGIWAKAFTANHFRIMVYDGASNFSSYHTGGGDWEWLEVTHTIPAATTDLEFQLFFSATPNVDGSTIVYVSQPMLANVPYIGEGNYQPRQQEVVWCEKPILSNLLEGLTDSGDVAFTHLNLEADSDGKIPKGCRAIQLYGAVRDSGSAGGTCYVSARADAVQEQQYMNFPYGKVNDTINCLTTWQVCDEGGDIDYAIEATGEDTMDILNWRYLGVQVN